MLLNKGYLWTWLNEEHLTSIKPLNPLHFHYTKGFFIVGKGSLD